MPMGNELRYYVRKWDGWKQGSWKVVFDYSSINYWPLRPLLLKKPRVTKSTKTH